MERFELAVVGGGPAGLSAAVTAAEHGVRVLVMDEQAQPGGQLFKQIHKFFGSNEHLAGVRGFEIGRMLLDRARDFGVEIRLGTTVYGLFDPKTIAAFDKDRHYIVQTDRIILATGASENSLAFPGWTLPGVMGAGAAQTLVNIHRILPGKRVLMVGSGNVGLIVSYQIMQAGGDVVALVEALPRIGGYGVHASKIRRAGVPIFTSCTVREVRGTESVESAVICDLDESFSPVPGSDRDLDVDTVCIAVGLKPLIELATMIGVRVAFVPDMGGHVPVHDDNMETNVHGVYIAGDISGVEEASSAMEEGRLAGLSVAESLGYLKCVEADAAKAEVRRRLDALRGGPFGLKRRLAKVRLFEEVRHSALSA
ncbi:MAG: FAD-dependent oxidoreductase [Firmicutes bacterium]|nr:FAD-dependent oxidoreductase [Bacillota bacterium]